jgi:hypothetical protein
MKKLFYVMPFLALIPLSAQTWEAGLYVVNQNFSTASIDVPGNEVKMVPDSKILYGARAGASILDLGPAMLQVTAAYQPETSTKVLRTTHTTLGTDLQDTLTFRSSNASVGAMFNFRTWASLGAGIECRFENYDLNGVKASYTRPWFRGTAGYTMPDPVLKPFIGLEVAFPLVSKSLDVNSSSDDRVRSLGPMLQVGIYGGVRF